MSNTSVDPDTLLHNLIPSILDPENILIKGKTEPLTGILYREALGLYIVYQLLNYSYINKGFEILILTKEKDDSENEDGAITILNNKDKSRTILYFEQVIITEHQVGSVTDNIITEIKKKNNKYSKEYYEKNILCVMLDKIGETDVRKVKVYLDNNNKFGYYILFYLEEVNKDLYKYAIINLEPKRNVYEKCWVVIDTKNSICITQPASF